MYQRNNNFFQGIPPVTKNLIIINALFWLAAISLPRVTNIDLYQILGLHFPVGGNFYPHQFFTYMFMHDGSSISHLFFNMFSLFMFGRALETIWGSKRFLTYYLITGIGAGIIQELAWAFEYRELLASAYRAYSEGTIASIGDYPVNVVGLGSFTAGQFLGMLNTVGASGAVFGILLAFGMIFPNAELFIFFIPIPIKAKYFVIFYGIIELVAGVSNFSFDNVAHFAHLGGMLFGYILIRYWKHKDYKNGKYFF